MAVPKRRVCHSRKKMRQSHQALSTPALAVDKTSKSVHRPHHIDLRTGLYNGKQVLFQEDGADAGSTEA
jgi:large subunit ribosomal protein L32